MKNLTPALSIAAAIVCSLLLLKKNHEAQEARALVAEAEAKREAIANQAAQEERQSKHLQTQLHQTQTDAILSALEAQKLRQQLSSPNAEGNKRPADALFRDPQMKEALMAQAREGVEKNVKSMFQSGLAQELHLSEEQAAQLHYLLMEKMSLLSEQILVPMMIGELNEAEMAASGKATRQAYDENTAKIRALLGDEGFRAYEQFEKTESERENLRRFVPKFEQAGQALSPGQQSQLLAAMTEERLSFKFQHDLGDMSQLDFEHWYDNFTDEKLIVFGREMEQLNDRMTQRAQALVTPDQVALLKSLLAEQLQQAKFVARTTTAMFGKKQ